MANERVKLVIEDSDGDKNQIFPITDMYSVIGLDQKVNEILTRLNAIDGKGTK
ncbi:hypothetical protein [Ligilactobacillus acidipiscis]|uniref:hypothetical protein n=1 Tax=Ligilactobacillus acidipiscis TaxID=89059 RepID=UPI0022DEA96C|nr:hypothetical protein [Ligilactobacillus acidipiscis]